jgi:hypothetical protein
MLDFLACLLADGTDAVARWAEIGLGTRETRIDLFEHRQGERQRDIGARRPVNRGGGRSTARHHTACI